MESVPLPPRRLKPKKSKSKKAYSFNVSTSKTEGSAAGIATTQQELPGRGERVSLIREHSGSSRGKSLFIELSRTQRIKLKVLDDFLQRIRALRTLEKDPLVASSIQVYFKALHEYQDLQVESLAAVLTPAAASAEKDNGEHLAKEKQLLWEILADADAAGPFDADMWTRWYITLTSVHLHSCKTLQNTRHFPEQERSAVVRALTAMEATFVPDGSVLESLVYCSTIYFIFEHFKSCPTTTLGSSMSQHGLTWSLRRCGFPLLVQFFETSHEKFDYMYVKTKVRDALGKRDWSKLMDFPRIVSPMVGLLIDRLVASVDKLSVLVSEKERMDDDAAQARAARLQHERQVTEGMCLICLDEKPNVATLCCGQPAHLNCIAQWLENHDSCPQCRGDFPPLTVRKAQPQPILRRRRATGSDGDSSWDVRTRHPAAEFVHREQHGIPREITPQELSLSSDESSFSRMVTEMSETRRTREQLHGRLVAYAGHLVREDVLDGHPRDARHRETRVYHPDGVSVHSRDEYSSTEIRVYHPDGSSVHSRDENSSPVIRLYQHPDGVSIHSRDENSSPDIRVYHPDGGSVHPRDEYSSTDSFNSVEVPQRPPPFRVVDDNDEESSSESEETSVYTDNNSVSSDDEDISIPSQPSQNPFHPANDQWADFTDEEHRYLFSMYIGDEDDDSSESQQIDD